MALDTDSCSLSLSLSLFSSSCESLRCAWGLGRGWDRKGVSPNQLEATRARFVLFHTASYWPGRAPQAHRDPRNVIVSATRTKEHNFCFVPVDSGTKSSHNTTTHKQCCSVTSFRTLSYCFVLLRTRPDARRRLTGTHETWWFQQRGKKQHIFFSNRYESVRKAKDTEMRRNNNHR